MLLAEISYLLAADTLINLIKKLIYHITCAVPSSNPRHYLISEWEVEMRLIPLIGLSTSSWGLRWAIRIRNSRSYTHSALYVAFCSFLHIRTPPARVYTPRLRMPSRLYAFTRSSSPFRTYE